MNRILFFRTLTLAFLFMAFTLSYGQVSQTVTITLTVDTTNLGSDRDAPGGCTLSANPSSVVIVDDGNPKNFTIKVPVGTDVIWEGITQDGEDVKIKKIGYRSGMNIFDTMNIPGRINNGREKVEAKVRRKTPRDMDYTYAIEFKVKGFGRYNLDPKIRVE